MHAANFIVPALLQEQNPTNWSTAGLPDGLFFRAKIPIWVNFGGH
jgi:hypothetical protein